MIIDKALSKVFGTKHERDVKAMRPRVAEINALEPEISALSDDALRARLAGIRSRVQEAAGSLPEELEERRRRAREILDGELVEVFAIVREAGRRALEQRHYDVQLMGGMVLHQGKISEMRTGEGKTLVATLPVTLNALTGRGVHVVTVNDYLAKRDAEWMGRIYRFLGLTVGCIQHDMDDEARREAYRQDITYGTNNEFGFDYLRDNMKFEIAQMVQRGHVYAIVDEVDSILIDEARTPLIISGPSEGDTDIYYRCDRIIPKLVRGEEMKDKYGNKTTTGDFLVDEKAHTAALTEEGVSKCERLLGVENLYDPVNIDILHTCQQALRAHTLYKRDVAYVVKEGQVIIVDEFTGRLMPGRRWSDGLHQAVEAKEGVKIERENQTLATITLQNYFRMYEKLAGMTGTADTEAAEFDKIYKLDVVVIPTNRQMVRKDESDLVYRTLEGKFDAVVEEIEEAKATGQPVLVGTVSIENSEYLADKLKRKGIDHQVLNAKFHEKEAMIVAEAGRFGAVTIATNMAGRGTDIILGGKPEGRETAEWQSEHDKVVEAGGLHIIGTERHESRRIDNQLRGRSGRQGDPGSSRFYVSFQDDLMRRFAPEWLPNMLAKLGMDEDVPIESGWVTKALENAQTKVEGHNFDIRKNVVEYDDVMNMHRDVIYKERDKVLDGAGLRDNVLGMIEEEIRELIDAHCPDRHEEAWDLEGLLHEMSTIFPVPRSITEERLGNMHQDEISDLFLQEGESVYEGREAEMGEEAMRTVERLLMLQTIDRLWVEHLTAMDEMRQGIGLQAYGQQDPLVAYKREAHDMWTQLLENIRHTIVHGIYHVGLANQPPAPRPVQTVTNVGEGAEDGAAAPSPRPRGVPLNLRENRPDQAAVPGVKANGRKVGRNDPCPCGSGKKYKRCHGVAA
jgi:preprotein translocase subunit SecA